MTVTLESIAEQIDYGHTASATETPVGPKFLRITDIQDGQVAWRRVPYCQASRDEVRQYCLRRGDIVFARTGATTGKSILIQDCPADSVFASYLIRVRPGPSVDPRFLSRFFDTPNYWAQIKKHAKGAGQPGVNATSLKSLQIPLPPLPEQKRIADILDKADAIRRKRQTVQETTDDLAKSAFVESFGHPLATPKWPLRPIGEVGEVTTGNTPSTKNPEFFGGNVLWVRPSELGDWKPVTKTEKTLSDAGLRVARSIRAGGIMVCCIGATLGKVGIVNQESAFNQQINAVDFGHEIDDWYGMFCMRLMAARFVAEATHTTLPILNKGDFSRQLMPVPPIELQERFGRFVSTLLESRRTITVAHEYADQLFNSLVQRAFNGEL